jgi:hypothetical protein
MPSVVGTVIPLHRPMTMAMTMTLISVMPISISPSASSSNSHTCSYLVWVMMASFVRAFILCNPSRRDSSVSHLEARLVQASDQASNSACFGPSIANVFPYQPRDNCKSKIPFLIPMTMVMTPSNGYQTQVLSTPYAICRLSGTSCPVPSCSGHEIPECREVK